ncbi:craniofacial development protein [Wolffia australiana]
MALLRRALRCRLAFERSSPPWPVGDNKPARSFYRLHLYQAIHSLPFSSTITRVCDSSSSSSEKTITHQSDQTSGMGSLYSLFARPSDPENPEFNAKSTVVKRISRRFSQKEHKADSANSGSSLEAHFSGEVLVVVDLLIRRLNEEGYLKGCEYSSGLVVQRVASNGFLRGFVINAAERFGKDHQEIAKWLSGSSLKKIALAGCPCMERKTVFAAKRLRSFFYIQEDVICRGCPMKDSCKFVNQRVDREQKLSLSDAMRVLSVYGLACGSAPQAMESHELRHAVCSSLKEVISLCS